MQTNLNDSHVSASQLGKGMLAGAVGGLIASWIMTQYQTLSDKASQALFDTPPAPERQLHHGTPTQHQAEPATVHAANAVAQATTGNELSHREKEIAGPAVHYAYGTLVGALYGGAAELAPAVTRGSGAPFGAALWLVGDELALPALGLSQPVDEIPARQHANSLAVHLVYGVVVEMLRAGLRSALNGQSRRTGKKGAMPSRRRERLAPYE